MRDVHTIRADEEDVLTLAFGTNTTPKTKPEYPLAVATVNPDGSRYVVAISVEEAVELALDILRTAHLELFFRSVRDLGGSLTFPAASEADADE